MIAYGIEWVPPFVLLCIVQCTGVLNGTVLALHALSCDVAIVVLQSVCMFSILAACASWHDEHSGRMLSVALLHLLLMQAYIEAETSLSRFCVGMWCAVHGRAS